MSNFFIVSMDLVYEMTSLGKLELFNLTMLMSSFISLVFFCSIRCFLTLIT